MMMSLAHHWLSSSPPRLSHAAWSSRPPPLKVRGCLCLKEAGTRHRQPLRLPHAAWSSRPPAFELTKLFLSAAHFDVSLPSLGLPLLVRFDNFQETGRALLPLFELVAELVGLDQLSYFGLIVFCTFHSVLSLFYRLCSDISSCLLNDVYLMLLT